MTNSARNLTKNKNIRPVTMRINRMNNNSNKSVKHHSVNYSIGINNSFAPSNVRLGKTKKNGLRFSNNEGLPLANIKYVNYINRNNSHPLSTNYNSGRARTKVVNGQKALVQSYKTPIWRPMMNAKAHMMGQIVASANNYEGMKKMAPTFNVPNLGKAVASNKAKQAFKNNVMKKIEKIYGNVQ